MYPKGRGFRLANQAHLSSGDSACICKSVRSAKSAPYDIRRYRTVTYHDRMPSFLDDYLRSQFGAQLLIVTMLFGVELFMVMIKSWRITAKS